MKQFKVQIRIKTGSSLSTIETMVSANSSTEAKKLVEGQYGSSLQSIYKITEMK